MPLRSASVSLLMEYVLRSSVILCPGVCVAIMETVYRVKGLGTRDWGLGFFFINFE
jgi:hypothetical protein